ncbi:MAG: DUF1232 domain-containing protein [Minisyncoccia bacterium]
MNKKIKTKKYFRKPKDFFVALSGIVGVIYVLNFGFGVVELLPDALPFVGHIDEAAALLLVHMAADYFGWNIGSFFKKDKK